MTTRTQASRSAGREPRTTWIARMPPAEPTTATTWIVGGSGVVRAIRPHEEAADFLRLPAGLLGDGLEASATAGGACRADSLGKPLAESRSFLQDADRRPQRSLDRLALSVDDAVRVCELGAHLSAVILAHVGLVRKSADEGCDGRAELGERQDAIRVVAHHRVDWQSREQRVVRRLHEDAAAPVADRAGS